MSFNSQTLIDLMMTGPLSAEVSYTPSGGSASTIRALPRTLDTEASFSRGRVRRDSMAFEIRVSDLANPGKDDLIGYAGASYRVYSEPAIADPDRLLWRIEAHEA